MKRKQRPGIALFKKDEDNQIKIGIIPFVIAPYDKRPIRFEGKWWIRTSFFYLSPWEQKDNPTAQGKAMNGEQLVAVFKDDLKIGHLGQIRDEIILS